MVQHAETKHNTELYIFGASRVTSREPVLYDCKNSSPINLVPLTHREQIRCQKRPNLPRFRSEKKLPAMSIHACYYQFELANREKCVQYHVRYIERRKGGVSSKSKEAFQCASVSLNQYKVNVHRDVSPSNSVNITSFARRPLLTTASSDIQ